ncbi:hypothetical protein [Niveispirillum sp.]|uniref:hypothetical protein n=1 Tax=Niveispirillum sp. TaxID=1917217 RepID=UPI001B56CD44|nr:hypothetical protein [Niveispirillum sp.]MBP7339903.1 hypothetical protein [Niveispirillum sp.]
MIMRQGGWRGWAARMLLPVLLFVALLPRGYMPDAQALRRGELSLTICRVAEPRRGDISTNTAGFEHLAACPFGLLPALSVPVEPAMLPLPWRWGIVAADIVDALIPRVGLWITGLGARGPPGM